MAPDLNPIQKEFAALMIAAGWSPAETSRQLNCSRANVSYILKGKSTPRPSMMELLRSKVIAAREKEKEKAKYPQKDEAIIVMERAVLLDKAGKAIDAARQKLADMQWAPMISWVSAGKPAAYEDQGYDVERFPTRCRDPHCYCLAIEGDSMEPKHSQGDLVFVAPSVEPRNGDLVIARTRKDDVYFKMYHWSGHDKDPVKLTSFNPTFPVMEFRRNELRYVQPVHSVLKRYRKD